MSELTLVSEDGEKGVDWKLIEWENETPYAYRVEYSPSNRAACRKCMVKIGKDELRIGEASKFGSGRYGYITSWMHPQCAPATPSLPSPARSHPPPPCCE
jgi:DNA repair protein RAD16